MHNISIFLLLLSSIIWANCHALAHQKKFRIITEEFPPFIGSNLKNHGWAMQVVKKALEPQGYTVHLLLTPWERAVRESKSGKYDGLYLTYYTEERAKSYVFSEPVGEVRTGLFKLQETDISFNTLQELQQYPIGVTRGVAISPEFDSAPFLQKEEVAYDILNIRKLLMGRIPLVAAPELVFRELIKKHIDKKEHNTFEFMEPALSIQQLHMAIPKSIPDHQQKLKDFNSGLQRIKADGTYQRILQEYDFSHTRIPVERESSCRD